MFKKIISVICLCMLFSFSIVSVSANEVNEEDLFIDDIEIIDDTTLFNTITNDFMFFETQDDRNQFLDELRLKDISLYVCLPGDPGYPHCSGTVVVKSELQTLAGTVNTGEIISNNYLCGNGGWVWGPGTVSFASSAGIGAQFTYNGSFSLSFSYTVTKGADFFVPAGKRGNIKYRANFKITPQRYKYTLNDGSVTYGAKFYTRTFLYGGSFLVTVNAEK